MPIRRAASPGRLERPTILSGGERELAALAGVDPGLGYLLLSPERRQRAGWWPAGRSRPGPRSLSQASTGSTIIFCRSPARRSPSRFVWPTRFRLVARAAASRPNGRSPAQEHRRAAPVRVGVMVGRGMPVRLLWRPRSERRCSPSPQLSAGARRGADDSIQGRAAVGCAAGDGTRAGRRARIWVDPHLYVWGWQSPLHFYGRLDSPTRHFFVDNLLRDQADRGSPADPAANRGDHRNARDAGRRS